MNINVYDEYINEISQLTGFEKEKIEILESKKSSPEAPNINEHLFKHNKKTYTIIDDKLLK